MSVLAITTEDDRQASGVAGVTRRRSHAGEHGRPCAMLLGQPMDIRKRSFIGSHQGVGGAHSTACIPKTT